MKKQDYLIQLIHSLSPSEKKYFRQYISMRHNSKEYEKLFDILLKAESYDADAVSRELKKGKKNLGDDKEYLQEILLRVLNNFHSSSMYRPRCFNGLIEAEILLGRGQSDFALSQVRKMKKGLLSGDENILYYLVVSQETNLIKMNVPGGLKAVKAVKDNGEDIVRRLEAILLYNKVVKISIEIMDLSADIRYISHPSILKKAAALVQEVNELTRGKKLSSLTYTTYHKMLATYYLFLGVDTKLSVVHGKKALQRFESETDAYKKFYRRDHYLINSTLMQAFFELKDFKHTELYLQSIKDFAASNVSKEQSERAERLIFRQTMMLHTAMGRHEEAINYINNKLPYYKKIRPDIEDISVAELMMAVNLFHRQQYNEALKQLLPLLASGAPSQLPETSITVRALNLMIQYEIGNIESMPDYLRSLERFFRKEKLVTKEVKLFLDLMRQLYRYGNKAPMAEFQKRLEDVYASHRFELIGHFVLLPWLRKFPRKAIR